MAAPMHKTGKAQILRSSDDDVDTANTHSRCSRHLQELRDALDLDQWKSVGQMPLVGDELRPNAVNIKSTQHPVLQNSQKRPPPEVVVYEDPRKRKKIAPIIVPFVKSGWKVKTQKVSQEPGSTGFNLRKAQNEVQRLAISGMNKLEKEEAKIALAVKLGAKPPKKKYYNYKELLALKKQEQQASEASLALDTKKFPISHRGGQKRNKDKNAVRAFDSQVGRFKNGVQMIKKNELFRMKKARRKTSTRL